MDLVLDFGSRSGSYTALALFTTVFALLGITAVVDIRRRLRASPQTASIVGAALFVGPIVLIYVSSLGGFYEIELHDRALTMRYLWSAPGTELALADIADLQALPAFKSRWRLRIRTRDGEDYESATSSRRVVEDAVGRLRSVLRVPPTP